MILLLALLALFMIYMIWLGIVSYLAVDFGVNWAQRYVQRMGESTGWDLGGDV